MDGEEDVSLRGGNLLEQEHAPELGPGHFYKRFNSEPCCCTSALLSDGRSVRIDKKYGVSYRNWLECMRENKGGEL